MTLVVVPAPSAGSTPAGQQAADTPDHVAGIVRSAESGMPLAGAMVVVVGTSVLSPTAANETIRPSAVFAREKLQRHLAGTVAQTSFGKRCPAPSGGAAR